MKKIVLSLQPSEATVVKAAAAIYAAHIAAGHVSSGQEKEIIAASIRDAISIAQTVDDMVQSDAEMG